MHPFVSAPPFLLYMFSLFHMHTLSWKALSQSFAQAVTEEVLTFHVWVQTAIKLYASHTQVQLDHGLSTCAWAWHAYHTSQMNWSLGGSTCSGSVLITLCLLCQRLHPKGNWVPALKCSTTYTASCFSSSMSAVSHVLISSYWCIFWWPPTMKEQSHYQHVNILTVRGL